LCRVRISAVLDFHNDVVVHIPFLIIMVVHDCVWDAALGDCLLDLCWSY
jgi:hypothetical protein